MATEEIAAGMPGFKDRKTGLMVFGILEVVLGIICLGMVFLMALGALVSAFAARGSAPQTSAAIMIPGILVYITMGAWFIWMGIGSILARRWARALMLVVSWIWLVSGLMGLVYMLAFMPDIYSQMGKSGQVPPQVAALIKWFTIGFMAVAYVLIPCVFILFYGSRHVKATCEKRDPSPRWTDKCPLPVLALSLMCAFWAICMPAMGFYNWAMPFFGVILEGTSGAFVALGAVLLLAYAAWGAYRLDIRAWWCAAFLAAAFGASAVITFSRVSLLELYARMDIPAQQLEIMQQCALPQMSTIAALCGAWLLIALAYLFYIRRFFAHR